MGWAMDDVSLPDARQDTEIRPTKTKTASVAHRIGRTLTNPSHAAWVQNIIIVISVAVAVITLRTTNANLAVSNSVTFAQKYYLEKPSVANAALTLRIAQYDVVKGVKATIPNYDSKMDKGWGQLFEKARPLVAAKILSDKSLQDAYIQGQSFFSSLILCVAASVCDPQTSVKLLGEEMLGFYNATCPYMEDRENQYGMVEDSPRFVAFLVKIVGYTNPEEHFFCREKAILFLENHK
jgi:hypothetical protein